MTKTVSSWFSQYTNPYLYPTNDAERERERERGRERERERGGGEEQKSP